MAFDAAASAVPPPTPGASAAAKSAAPKNDASDPFGALLAMVGNDRDTQDAPKAPPATSKTDTPDKASAPAKAKDDASVKDPAKDDEPADATAPDASTLVAAMMAPAAPPAAVPPAAVSAPTAPPAAGSAPAAVVDAGAMAPAMPVQADAGLAAKDAAAVETAPHTPIATPQAQTPAPAPAPAPAPTAAADKAAVVIPAAVQVQDKAEATPQAATPADPAHPAEQPAKSASDQPKAETATSQAVRNPDARQDNGHDHGGQNNGQRSDADASQVAEGRKSSAPDAGQQTALLDAADAAPNTAAPTPAAPPPATVAAAPLIQTQAAILPVRGSPETVAHLAAQMIQRLDGQTTRFDLSLNPQSLGRVDVRIEIGAKGVLKARMAFDDAASAHELSGRHAELRAALQSAGFDVPEGAITYDVASGGSGGGAFAERQDGGSNGAPAFYNLADTADQDPAAAVKNYFSAAGSSGVDIRV